jgi:hypothetical protein
MSAVADRARVRQALETAGNWWFLDHAGAQVDDLLDTLGQGIREFIDEYKRRFGEEPDPFGLVEANPVTGMAFFQVDTLRASVEMKIMVWRVLLGSDIDRIRMEYDAGGRFFLSIIIRTPYGGSETYESSNGWDFRVLRHLGATAVNGRMMLQGYYAMKSE